MSKQRLLKIQRAEKAAALGITPVEVMLENMKVAYAAGDRITAQECAKDVAPYIHPRLSVVNANIDQTVTHVIADARERLAFEIDRLEAEELTLEGAGRADGRGGNGTPLRLVDQSKA